MPPASGSKSKIRIAPSWIFLDVPRSTEGHRQIAWNRVLFLACATIFGAVLRIRHLGARSLWMDESATAAITSLDWSSFWKLIFSREMNMSAYYLLLRAFPFLHRSEILLRLPSVLFGCGLIGAVWLLSKHVFEESRQLVRAASVLLVAVNGFLIAYSQEARGYAMAVCLLVASTWVLALLIKTGRHRVTWSVLALAALYTHFYAVLWIAPQVWAIWTTHRKLGWKFFRRIVVVAAVGLLPLIVFVCRTRGGQLDWVPKLTLRYLLDVFVQIAGYSSIALALLVLGSTLGCIALWRSGDVLSRTIVLEAILPILVLLVFSPIHPLFVPRFLIFAIPFLTLTAMVGFGGLRMDYGVLAFAGLFATMLVVGNRSASKGDWKTMTEYLCSQPDRAVAFWPAMQRLPFWYYSRNNPGCRNAVTSEQRELTLADFGGNKREFAAKLCASNEKSIVMVMESEWQGKMPTTIMQCYVPMGTTTRNGLEMLWLQRSTGIETTLKPNRTMIERTARN
jgi:mannosyltransferase